MARLSVRLSVLGVVACCGVVLSAAGTPASDGNRSSRHPLAAAPADSPSAGGAVTPGTRDMSRPAHQKSSSTSAGRSSRSSASRSSRSSGSRSARTNANSPSREPVHAWPSGSAPPPALHPVGGKPGPGNTGVPAGTPLRRYDGNLVITRPGATYDALDIHGFVVVMAPNVTIRRSIIRGGHSEHGRSMGLVTDIGNAGTNFVLADSELVPEHPSVALDGIQGGNYTLLRVNLHGTVDGAKIFGNNVVIQRSWLHGTVSYAHDPYQRGGPTHNDAIQVLGGHNILITGNTVDGGTNSALQITQDYGPVSNLTFTDNWVDGGGCSANIADKPRSSMRGINISNNRFGHNTRYWNCAVIVSYGVSMRYSGNTWANTRQPVAVMHRR
jgi:hypothetical protein